MGFKKRKSIREQRDGYISALVEIAKHETIDCDCGRYGDGCDCYRLTEIAAHALSTDETSHSNPRIPTYLEFKEASRSISRASPNKLPSIRAISTVLAYQFGFELNDDNSISRPN